jgi:hypothetical protein
MINPPKDREDYPDRRLDCEEALKPLFHDMLCVASAQRWGPAETRAAIFRLLAADRRKDFENAKLEMELAIIRARQRAAKGLIGRYG